MNKLLFSIIIFSVIVSSSCVKRDLVSMPNNFIVSTDKTTYNAGDTVYFNFIGNPENIVYWSGQSGHVYEYRNRTFASGNKLTIDFTSYQRYGINDTTDIKLLVSTNFNGIYDSADVIAATWQDISNRAQWSPNGNDNYPSGTIDLSDIAANDTSNMAIAFRYTSKITGSNTNQWIFRTFNINNISSDGSITSIATMSTAGWQEWSVLDPINVWANTNAFTNFYATATQIVGPRSTTKLEDDWIITKTFNPNAISPDQGLAIKNISNSVTKYGAVYSIAGTYKATFVATNASYKNQESVVKELTITVN